ncbi:MAG: SDR family oxidoreductase [Acidimicrobiia bacterium]|nr:SDR family oxidoreductase [Acidimicrobiia bacterium]
MTRRVALVAPTGSYVGPPLARLLAAREHDLVIADPADGLVDELEELGAAVEVVDGASDLSDPAACDRLVSAGLARFGQIHAACMFSGRIVIGRFLDSTVDDLHAVVNGNIEAPYHFLKHVLPTMLDAGDGQVLVITSASAARPTLGAPLYSATRAGASMLVKNVAAEVADKGVQINAVGTNFMDFPEFIRANRIETPEQRAKVESYVPMKRLGTMEEFASFCAVMLDGTSRFQTGQFISYSGGWSD